MLSHLGSSLLAVLTSRTFLNTHIAVNIVSNYLRLHASEFRNVDKSCRGVGRAEQPRTVSDLVTTNALVRVVEIEYITCSVCHGNDLSGPNPELPLKLPAYGHTLGMECIKTWLGESNNSCPMC